MRSFFYIALILAFFTPAQSFAQSLDCTDTKTRVKVRTSIAPTKYVRTQSVQDLTEMHAGYTSMSYVGGLGGGEVGFNLSSEFRLLHDRVRACVMLKEIELILYTKPTIHVAKNFRRGTCEYAAVVEHEKKHIRVLRKFIREHESKIRKEFTRIVRAQDTTLGPMKMDAVEAAQDAIQNSIFKRIEPVHARLMEVLAARQEAIDTPEEYERVHKQCKNWSKRIYNE